MELFLEAPPYAFSRLLFERILAALYFIGFLSAYNQFPALLGEKGLLPVTRFLSVVSFKEAPSLFHWRYSDKILKVVCVVGMGISLALMLGLSGYLPIVVHILLWLSLYALYMSLVNVGQVFYSFGWESMLLEAGFFMAFMGPDWVSPSWIPLLTLRWMLFRTELGAGLIKMRGDKCWRDLTCLYYHHETQPMPNPLSRTFHHGPKWFHKGGVLFSHFVQLIIPFGVFLPQPVAGIAGGLTIIHQFILIISGNYSWLNWLTVGLGILCIADPPQLTFGTATLPLWFTIVQILFGVFIVILSYRPLLNLFSRRQKMNYHWNRFHLVGAYGAFGSVTKERYEIVLEGTREDEVTPDTEWKEIEFKGKPTSLARIPGQFAPYHLRLDWCMWFLPFSVRVGRSAIHVFGFEEWFIRMIVKLLQNDGRTRKLLNECPENLVFIRARFYQYEFTTRKEKKESGHIWKRRFIDNYLPPVRLNDLIRFLD